MGNKPIGEIKGGYKQHLLHPAQKVLTSVVAAETGFVLTHLSEMLYLHELQNVHLVVAGS